MLLKLHLMMQNHALVEARSGHTASAIAVDIQVLETAASSLAVLSASDHRVVDRLERLDDGALVGLESGYGLIQALAQLTGLRVQEKLAPHDLRRRLLLIVHHRGPRVAEGHQVAGAIGHLHLALPLRWVLIRLLPQRVLLLIVVVVRILQDGRKPLLDVAKRAR